MNVIEANNLKFSYDGKNDAIKGVSFSICSGKYYSIIGHNGSGKSTLAKLLIGLLKPSKDSLKTFGLEYNSKNIKEIRRKVGIVFQNPDNQFIGSTVKDDIAFGLENRCVPQKDMDKIIEEYSKKVDMFDYLDKQPEKLSGGQKQRVAIAGVLAMHPEVIIFDEATAMLDPKGKREISELIKKMRIDNPNLTLISITHDVEEAFNSDEIIVMNEGEIYMSGSPKEILSKSEELEKIHLGVPFLYSLANELNKLGIKVDDYSSLESLVNDICQ